MLITGEIGRKIVVKAASMILMVIGLVTCFLPSCVLTSLNIVQSMKRNDSSPSNPVVANSSSTKLDDLKNVKDHSCGLRLNDANLNREKSTLYVPNPEPSKNACGGRLLS